MAAFHGNRREEAAILKVKNVRQTKGGIWYFAWSDPELRPLLKEVGSARDVPLHKDFLDLGFIEARVIDRDLDAKIYPEAHSFGVMERHAEPFGKWYGHFLHACGILDEALDFHAWRHTVVTLLKRSGVPDSHIEELVGHESENRRSELGTYDHGTTIELLKETIDKLVIPFDFSTLKAAVASSDALDRTAAWTDLTSSEIVPHAKRKRS